MDRTQATELSQHERSLDILRTLVEPHLFRSTSLSIITRAANQNSDYTGAGTSNSKADLSGTDEVAASPSHSSTLTFVTISMQDLYNANKPDSASISLSAPPGEDHETKASVAISGSSLEHGSLTNINSTTSNPEPNESQAEGLRRQKNPIADADDTSRTVSKFASHAVTSGTLLRHLTRQR